MGTKRDSIVDELRVYDDAKNPETSEYDVMYLKTIPSAVIDPKTNTPLSDKLVEYDDKIKNGGIGEPGIGIYVYESEAGNEGNVNDITRVKTTAGRTLKRGDLLISTKGNLFEVSAVNGPASAPTSMTAYLITQLKGSSIYYSTQTSNGSNTADLTLSTVKLPAKTSLVAADLVITASMEMYRVTSIYPSVDSVSVEYINTLKGNVDQSLLNEKLDKVNPTGTGAISFGRKSNTDVGVDSAVFGLNSTASGDYSSAFGINSTASGFASGAFGGNGATASGDYSFVFGNQTVASANYAVAFGTFTTASKSCAVAFGTSTTASGSDSVAVGQRSTASGSGAVACGSSTNAEGGYSAAFGLRTTASGHRSVVFGQECTASGNESVAFGKFNNNTDDIRSANPTNMLSIGFGASNNDRKNVFRVSYDGKVYALSSTVSTGADYAEYIKPWFDGNADNEDRRGYFVTIRNGKLYKAEPGDYIVGITSGNPSVIGNGDEDWLGRWKRDEFNELIFEDVEVDDYETQIDDAGNPVEVKIGSHIERQTVQVEDYDPSQKYIERKNRPEWSCVGMIGVIPLRDDGTCEPGGFAKCRGYGIATKADEYRCHETFFVIERINDHIVSVEMR